MKNEHFEKIASHENSWEKIKEKVVGMNLDGFEPTKWDETTMTMGREMIDPASGKRTKAEVIFDRASGEAKEAWIKDEEGKVLQFMNLEVMREQEEEAQEIKKSRLN